MTIQKETLTLRSGSHLKHVARRHWYITSRGSDGKIEAKSLTIEVDSNQGVGETETQQVFFKVNSGKESLTLDRAIFTRILAEIKDKVRFHRVVGGEVRNAALKLLGYKVDGGSLKKRVSDEDSKRTTK